AAGNGRRRHQPVHDPEEQEEHDEPSRVAEVQSVLEAGHVAPRSEVVLFESPARPTKLRFSESSSPRTGFTFKHPDGARQWLVIVDPGSKSAGRWVRCF